MMEELGFTIELLNNGYATGSAALAVGALIFIPFALKFGRRTMYLVSLLGQMAVMVWSAKMENPADLILTNLFNCLLGALAEVIVQMTIAGKSSWLPCSHTHSFSVRLLICYKICSSYTREV